MRDTEQLTFFLLQGKIDNESLSKIEPFQWHQICQKLSNNPASVVIFLYLKKRDLLNILPQEVREKWQGYYYNNIKRNTLALQQITELQSTLKEAGIKFILLKGASLIFTVYNNLGLRSFADIDLLVSKKDLLTLKYKLESLNYRLQDPKKALLLGEFGCSDWIFLKKGALPLDIHWQLCQYERFKGIIKFNEEEIFQDAINIDINNIRMLSLSNEDLFLYLGMHLALVHGFSGFHWFYDLKAVIDYCRHDFDWGLLIKKARKANLACSLYYVLYFYRELLDTDFHPEILKCIRPSFIKRSLMSLFIDKRNILGLSYPSRINKRYYIGQGFLVDSILGMIWVFIRMLFPSREWLLYRYSADRQEAKIKYSYRLRHIFNIAFNFR